MGGEVWAKIDMCAFLAVYTFWPILFWCIKKVRNDFIYKSNEAFPILDYY